MDQLDDAAQHAAAQVVMNAGIPRLQAFSVIQYLLRHGKPAGRREAAVALAKFQGAEANTLALKALEDDDPQVQANIVMQLRHRSIPGVLPRLVQCVDSPHAVVRQAVRETLQEFAFDRYIAAFDMLDDEVRHGTGMLVKKIDPQTLPRLKVELDSPARTRRLRGVAVARVIDAVEQLEEVIIGLLQDEDHLVRVEATAALARCTSGASEQALEEALSDSSTTVQEAARKSLSEHHRSTPSGETRSDPRG